jgi:DNA polymerase-4
MSPVAVPACVLHLDADAFFASVEQRDDPRLLGRPVAVGSGVVASCSYEARRYGVRTGMRLADARRLCPSLCIRPGDWRRYEQAARRIQAICLDQTSRVEAAALDDLYLDLSDCSVPPEELARALVAQVRAEVGLEVSIGIGTGKFVAAVATQQAKQNKQGTRNDNQVSPTRSVSEDTLTRSASEAPSSQSPFVRVPAGTERDFLAPWPVDTLPGVGPKGLARLGRLNVQRVGEVADMPLGVLCGLFGKRGRLLRDLARGIDPRPVGAERRPRSVSRSTSLEPPSSDLPFLAALLDYLLERAASWLRLSGLAARGLTVSLRYGDSRSEDGRVALPNWTDREGEFRSAARARFAQLYVRRLPLRFLGVALAPLRPADGQVELFPDPADERARRLTACKDAIRQRFGFTALLAGSTLLLADQLEHDRDNFRLRTPCLTR